MTEPITDKNLLRCTFKKSVNVTTRLVLYAAYLIDTVAALAILLYGASNIWAVGSDPLLKGISAIISWISGIPQYITEAPLLVKLGLAGICILAGIGIYSLLWCIARDLDKEDWESNAANGFAVAFLATFTFVTFVAAVASATFAAVVSVAFLAFLAVVAVDPADRITVWGYYVFRFIGATYHHYIKQGNIRGTQ